MVDAATRALDTMRGRAEAVAEAEVLLKRAAELDPDSPAVLNQQARLLVHKALARGTHREPGALAPAENALRKALEIDPGNARALVLLGNLYRILDRPEEAHAALDRAERIGTDDPWLDVNRADLLRDAKEYGKAIPHCERVLAREDLGELVRRRAEDCLLVSYVGTKRLDDAEALYRNRIAGASEDPEPHADLARFLLCRRGDTQAAVDAAKHAIRLGDERWPSVVLGAALYTRWSLQQRTGDASAARKAWRDASAFPVEDPAAIVEAVCDAAAARAMRFALRDAYRGAFIPAPLAVMLASEAAPGAVGGVFALEVEGVGRDDGEFFLNSKEDYRDPATLTIHFTSEAGTAFHALHGEYPDTFLMGKQVTVVGEVRRKRIDFLAYGVPTGKFYYQTHVDVTDAAQVAVFDPARIPVPEDEDSNDI